MASEWNELTLGEFVTLQRGHDLPTQKRVSGSIPILGSFGITGWHNASKVNGPGVTVGRSGASYGVVTFSDVDFWPLNTALFVKDFHGNDPLFASYLLKSMDFTRYNSGSAVQSLNRNHIHPIKIKFPSLVGQKAIAHILGSLDDKIELNRQMNETLESMAQALFKSWFVDFDPVIDNALAAGNPIPDVFAERAEQRKELKNGKVSFQGSENNHQSLFPSEFEFTEEMGWIPKGWEVSDVGSEFNTVGGGTPSTKNLDFWDDGDINWTTPKDLSGNQSKVLLGTNRRITDLGLTKISSGLLPVDTVLMSSRAPVGYLALAKVPVAINQGYIAINGEKTLTSEYALLWAESVMDEIKQRAGGTTFAEISKNSFRDIPLFIPGSESVGEYSQFVKDIYNQITQRLQNIELLTKLRDTLLPKLLSGELRIPDAEKLLENV